MWGRQMEPAAGTGELTSLQPSYLWLMFKVLRYSDPTLYSQYSQLVVLDGSTRYPDADDKKSLMYSPQVELEGSGILASSLFLHFTLMSQVTGDTRAPTM